MELLNIIAILASNQGLTRLRAKKERGKEMVPYNTSVISDEGARTIRDNDGRENVLALK